MTSLTWIIEGPWGQSLAVGARPDIDPDSERVIGIQVGTARALIEAGEARDRQRAERVHDAGVFGIQVRDLTPEEEQAK